MTFRYLDKDGAISFWTNIKNYILSKIPTKTSELTNDSNFVDTSNSAVASGITSTKVTSYDSHVADTDIHVTTVDKTKWNTVTSKANDSDVVHLSGDESVAGNKNFKGLLTTIPNATLWPVVSKTTDDITLLHNSAVHVEQRGSGNLTDLSSGAWNIANLGIGCFFFRINNGTDIRYKNFAQNTVNRIYVVSNANRQLNNVTPETDNTYSLGDSTRRWKECYSNAYYLGTTAFGDIVTHNASEFLTSHQSLSNYSTLANTVKSLSISGKKITVTPGSGSAYTLTTQDTVYTHPTTSGNKHIPSGGSSGQFLGWDSDGTAKWVNNPNTNTDTLMTQNVSTTNATYPVLLVATADATANQGAKTGIFAKSVKVNPSTNVISASGFSGPLTGNVTGNCSGSSGSCTGNAATATQFSANKSVTLTGDVTGTASSKAGWSVATTLANSGVTAGNYGPSADASPAHSGKFTVPSITVDAKGRITAASTKTITLPADNNTDTKVTQTVTTANSGYPVLLCATASATVTETTTSRFSAGLTVNTRYSSIYITNKYDTANTKGVRNTSTYNNGILYFRSYDASEMGTIRCESSKNGYQQTYMQARSYIKDGAISPEGTATTCYITVRVRDNGSKTIYTDGSWENSLTPYANNTYSLGTSSLQWKNAYIKNLNLNGNAFDPASTSGNIGDIVFARAYYSAINNLTMTAGGNALALIRIENGIYVEDRNNQSLSGTWKFLGSTIPTVTSGNASSTCAGVWKRIT